MSQIDPPTIFHGSTIPSKPIFPQKRATFRSFFTSQVPNRGKMATNPSPVVPSCPRREQRKTQRPRNSPGNHPLPLSLPSLLPPSLLPLSLPLSLLVSFFLSFVQIHFCFAPFNGREFSECLPGGWLKMNFT